MSGHTKGRWVVTSDGHYVTPEHASTKIIALVFRPDTDSENERHANARLIAAAPDLLEALTEARTTLAMLKRSVVTEIARHDGLLRWEGVPEAIQARIDECDAAITRADGGGA